MRSRLPRPIVLALAAMVLAPLFGSVASAAEVKLVRVWPEYRTGASFKRIAEYFGGKEKAPEHIVRSRPESREGYYFLARFKSAQPLPGSMIALEYFLPGEDLARVQFFPVNLPKGSRAILAGLTGEDWPGGAEVAPTAWRLRLLGPGGVEVAREQSFLWAMPPATATAASSTEVAPAGAANPDANAASPTPPSAS